MHRSFAIVLLACVNVTLFAVFGKAPPVATVGNAPSPVFEFGPLQVVRPTLTRGVNPRFPGQAARAGLSEATVVLETRIDLTGRPQDLKVLRCTEPGYRSSFLNGYDSPK